MAYPRKAGLIPACSRFLRTALAALALLGASQAVHAQARTFPAEARKAVFAIAQYPAVVLDGKARRLSAAARIRNADNLIVMPAVLGDTRYVVRYTEDFMGEVNQVWILTAEEARAR